MRIKRIILAIVLTVAVATGVTYATGSWLMAEAGGRVYSELADRGVWPWE